MDIRSEVLHFRHMNTHTQSKGYIYVLFFGEQRLLAASCLSIRLCVSVRPQGTTQLTLDGLSWSFRFEHFSKFCRDNSNFINFFF